MIHDVRIKKTKNMGTGVFAHKNFKKGALIFRYPKGKIVKKKELSSLSSWDSHHLDELDNNQFEVMTAPACFINHSCNPNIIPHKRAYFALRNIKKGEELCSDYRIKGIFKNRWTCKCGGKNCKSYVISDFFTLDEHTQKAYLPYTLKTIRKEYKRRKKLQS